MSLYGKSPISLLIKYPEYKGDFELCYLREELESAIQQERYEDASKLRDKINAKLSETNG